MSYARHYRIRPGLLGYFVEALGDGPDPLVPEWITLSPKPFGTKEEAEKAIRRLSEPKSHYDENGEAV